MHDNAGQRRTTQDNAGQHRTTQDNAGQRRTTHSATVDQDSKHLFLAPDTYECLWHLGFLPYGQDGLTSETLLVWLTEFSEGKKVKTFRATEII
ncbi:hypothetical protein STEG23_009727 [Scotinomys teguina]